MDTSRVLVGGDGHCEGARGVDTRRMQAEGAQLWEQLRWHQPPQKQFCWLNLAHNPRLLSRTPIWWQGGQLTSQKWQTKHRTQQREGSREGGRMRGFMRGGISSHPLFIKIFPATCLWSCITDICMRVRDRGRATEPALGQTAEGSPQTCHCSHRCQLQALAARASW